LPAFDHGQLAMLNSMTAFARHAFTFADAGAGDGCDALAEGASSSGITLTWELRTVNHRFLDIALRLPDACRDLDAHLRELARARLARGRLDGTLRLQERDGRAATRIDPDALTALLRVMHALHRDQPQLGTPTVLDVLRWPGVLEEQRPDQAALAHAAEAGFRQALEALAAGRASEGAALARALTERLAQIEAIVAALRAEAQDVPHALRARILGRLQDLGTEVDPQRIAQEVALLAQRADVAEELDRLDAHVAAFRQALARNEPVGRHLDFLAQELNREANTLSSKASSAAMAQRGIELKVLIEQIREQVQNVE
jgi:uncharacterized protein (TIGR00255 family)